MIVRAIKTLFPLLLVFTLPLPAASGEPGTTDSPFPVRMVKLAGEPSDPAARQHLEFAASLGFNAVWVYSHQAGEWTAGRAPDEPFLDPSFIELAGWCRARSIRIYVSINPVAATGDRFTFYDRKGERRIRRFFRLLRRQCGVRDFILSFDDQPTRLSELNDILRFGLSAAPAHLDLTRRLSRSLGRRNRLWLCASAYCDAHLGTGKGEYSSAFLSTLHTVPARVGIVWTGPEVISGSITADDLARTRTRLGGRELLLYDNFGVNGDHPRLGLGLVLAPLRNRDPEIHRQTGIYLACTMSQLGGSRLTLTTIADYLSDPAGYEEDSSWLAAMRTMAGPSASALKALRTQTLEWGGVPHGRNWRHASLDSALTAAARLDDPAFVSLWTWTVKRYPQRMKDLQGLSDEVFRTDLLEAMAKRLTIARTVPLVLEYRARLAGGRLDAAETLRAIDAERSMVAEQKPVLRVLERFLAEAGIRR